MGFFTVQGPRFITRTTEATDPIPEARQTDWTYTGVPGGIPTRTSVFQTFSVGATAAQITTALNNAADEQVVALNAGTYSSASLGGKIDFAGGGVRNVTLRGAGMGVTILQGANIIGTASGSGAADGRTITGATKGGFTFTVASATGLAAGKMIVVDRSNDTSLIPASFSTSRDMIQSNIIVGVSGLTITVRNPWFYDFSVGTPTLKLLYSGLGTFSRVGIEDLTLDHGVAVVTGQLFAHDSCWLKNVESVGGTSYHFIVLGSTNFEARGCYIHDGGAGPNNSGINLYGDATTGANSHWRIEDCIFANMFPAVEVNQGSNGGYCGYNYVPGSNTGVSWSLDDGHGAYNFMNLYEGNQSDTWGQDGYFGGGGLGTVFRNYFTGENIIDPDVGNPVNIKRLGYYYNIVGNVLGQGSQTLYQGCSPPGIYSLGYPNIGNCSTTDESGIPWTPDVGGVYPDATVSATLMRWGNYDYVNDTTRWEVSELNGVSTPPDHTLIKSYVYENTQPSWWTGGVPWPPIGPDVTGGNADTAGHANKIPARLRYEALGAASIEFQALLSETGFPGQIPDGTLGPFAVASATGQERLLCLCAILQEENDVISSVSIDGEAATQVGSTARVADGSGNGCQMSFWRASGTANTSINVTYSTTTFGGWYDLRGIIWSMNEAGALLDSTIATTHSSFVVTLDIDTTMSGVVAAAMLAYDSSTHVSTWSGLTERFDGGTIYTNDWVTAADVNTPGGSIPLPITVTVPSDYTAGAIAAMAVSFNYGG